MGRGGSRRAGVAWCRLLTVALVGGYLLAAGPSSPDASPSPDRPQEAIPKALRDRPPRVLILGDSIADQHGRHAAIPLRAAGVEVRLATRWGGGLLTRGQYDMGHPLPNPSPQSLMADATAMVDELDPDLVAVYSNHNYWQPYPRDTAGREILRDTPAFQAMVQAQLRELYGRLTRRGARVYLIEPFPYEGDTAEDNPVWAAYLSLQPELGFGVIRSGRALGGAGDSARPVPMDCAGRPVVTHAADGMHLTYAGAGLMGTFTARALAAALGIDLPAAALTAPTEAPVVLVPDGVRYRVVTCEGATFGFGGLSPGPVDVGARSRRAAGDPVVAAATTALGREGWLVTRSGTVLSLAGTASYGNLHLRAGETVVGMAAATDAEGYWVATSSGRVQPFGRAPALGDLAGRRETVVAMASTPDRHGYWLLAASGRVEGFGSAVPVGDRRGHVPSSPLVGMAAHPSGQGYWLLDRAGGVHPFGAARDFGSADQQQLQRILAWRSVDDYDREVVPAASAPTQAVGLLPTTSGEGYWIALANGAVCHFGDAQAAGGLHLVDIQALQAFFHVPYYRPGGACSQRRGDRHATGETSPAPTPAVGSSG